MILKVNRKTGKEVVIATTSASNIDVDDPRLIIEKTPLSDVLYSHQSQITTLQQNVKWLYKYGGTGAGGNGSGGGSRNAYIEVLNNNLVTVSNDNIIYESDNKLVLKYRIFQQGGSYTYHHTLIVNNKKLVNNQPLRTNVEASIVLDNLSTSEPNIVRISAIDDQGFSLQDYVLRIVSGSINISSPTVTNNGSISRYYGTGDIEVDFNINNRVLGSATVLEIKLNNMEDGKVLRTFNNDGIMSYRLRIMEQLNGGQMLETGTTYTITAQAFSNLNSNIIPSSIYTFTVALIDNKSLIVIVNGLSEEYVPDDDINIATFLQGSDISFNYSINAASYSTFRIAFEILDAHKNIIDSIGSKYPPGVVFDENGKDLWESNKVVTKGVSNTFSYSSSKVPIDKIGIMYVNVYAWSIDSNLGSGVGEDAGKNTPTKTGKLKLVKILQSVPAYTNANNTLHLNMDVPIDFSELQDKDYFRFSSNVFDEQNNPVVNSTNLNLFHCNHISSGFIKNRLSEDYPTLRLAGGAYGHMNINYFNGSNIGSWSIISAGWTFSFAFKTDQHPDANGTVFSHGMYDADGILINGIEITLDSAKMVFLDGGSVKTVSTTIIQNVMTVVDFVCEKNPSDNTGMMQIYLDGALSAVELIENPDQLSLGILSDGAYLGCKKVLGNLVEFCDVNIYNMRVYKKSLIVPDLINNYVINYSHLSKYADGSFNWTEIELMKNRNFITPEWNNLLWDYISNTWKTGTELFDRINQSPVLPVLLISETTSSSVFHDMYKQSYNEANADMARNYKTPCSMTYRDVSGNIVPVIDMFTSLQGTSTLGYYAKNLEIYFGEGDDGLPRLFTPENDWLPENQFTLKADVIDSAHANNTSIGKFINDYFEDIHPMKLVANPYRTKVKHTLQGFPIYLFMKFGDNLEPTFLGIYNFNLGRGSNYNMGFKVLSNYELEYESAPSLVKKYEELVDPYNGGVFSFEFNTNSPTDIVAFQQPDRSIVDHIIDQRYPAKGHPSERAGWNRLYQTFEVFSRFYQTTDAPKKWIYSNGQFIVTNENVGTKLLPSMEYFPKLTDDSEGFIFWNNACRYFCAAMAFGMVDSLGKNMTLRSWNVNQTGTAGLFNIAFYDMDTSLALDNYGKEDIPPTCYIDYWYNAVEDGYTVARRIINGAPAGVKTFDMPSSRLWEIVRLMGEQFDPGNVDLNYQSYWSELRKTGGMLENVDKFMDNYYLKHVKDIGSIIYNLDYNIKYMKKYSFQNSDGTETIGYNDLQFLHGTRRNYVRSWLEQRLRYIDSCMNIAGLYHLGENTQWVGAYQSDLFKDSPYVNQWNGRGNGSEKEIFEFDIVSNTPILFFMTIATNSQRVLLMDNETSIVKFKGTRASSSTMSWNNTNNISRFTGFDQLNFNSIGIFTMKNLLELDFSNIASFDQTKESEFNIAQLSELRRLNFENMKSVNPASGFIVNVSRCIKLKSLNIRNSDVGSLILPGGGANDDISAGVIEQILLSGSLLNNFSISNQRFIKSLDFTNCRRLMNVNISTLYALEEVIFNNNEQIQSINISNCPNLKTIRCNNSNALIQFTIDNCENVDIIDISHCANNQLEININGAFNLGTLDLSYTQTKKNPIIPSWEVNLSNLNFYNTLHTLNISNSNIKAFDFGIVNNTSKYEDEPILDLSHFKSLNSWDNSLKRGLLLTDNNAITYVKFNNNSTDPYILDNITYNGSTRGMFYGCMRLLRVFGHVALNGNLTFSNCDLFFIHDEYKVSGITQMPVKGAFHGPDTKTEENRNQWNKNIGLDTNIKVTSTSLSSAFTNTSVNLYNVYYILQQCDNVTSLNSTFSTCKEIKTETLANSLNRNTFKYCGKVTSMASIFTYCSNLRGILYSPHVIKDSTPTDPTTNAVYDGLLSPLKSLTGSGFNSAFYSTGIQYIDEYFFFKLSNTEQLKISSLTTAFYGPSWRFVEDSNATTMVVKPGRASKIFKYLPNLTGLSYFPTSGTNIEFDTITEKIDGVDVTYCPIFFNNTKLTSISNSFGMAAGGSLINMWGGQQELINKYPNNFPQNFAQVTNSFHVSSTPAGLPKLELPLRNDMFNRIRHSLVAIAGTTIGSSSSTSSFSGTINKTYNPKDSDYEIFPRQIFSGMTKLRDISAFFMDLNYSPGEVIELPAEGMFRDNVSLESVSYLFYDMVGVRYKLRPKEFINTKLTNTVATFSNSSNTNGTSANIQGSIPYGLFYMEQNLNKTVRGWKAGGSITDKYGFDSSGNYLPNVPMPQPINNVIAYRDIRRSINDMTNVLRNMSGPELSPYNTKMDTLENLSTSGDVLRYNEKYNDVMYILNNKYNADVASPTIPNPEYDPSTPGSPLEIPNPEYDNRRVIVNPDYDTRFRVWNEWCVDGSNIREIILGSELYKNGKDSYGHELPDNFYDINNTYNNPSASTYLRTMNYVCPPDLFRYCINNTNTVVNYALAGSNKRGSAGDDKYGMTGRIPAKLFEPINQSNTIIGVFSGFLYLAPYSWPHIDEDGRSQEGRIYPPELLKTFGSRLRNISYLFNATQMADGCIVDPLFLYYNTALENLNSTWGGSCWWHTSTNIQQLPINLFANNKNIQNIGGLIGNGESLTGTYRTGPSKIDKSWFTASNHKSINNIAYFANLCVNSIGELPEFWKWTNISATNRSYAFNNLSRTKITNLDEAASSKYSSSVTNIQP